MLVTAGKLHTALFMAVSCCSFAAADDWTTFRHDQQRSGRTSEQLNLKSFALEWEWQSELPPSSAWPDSARWDAYAKLDGLRSMRDYDTVFHPVVSGDALLIGSNVDDTVRSFSLATGKLNWRFTARAPVRVAPTISGYRVYFGSDDGYIYALELASGQLIWKKQLVGGQPEFVNDGRFCSFQPLRSGVLIDEANGTVLVAAGIFPWEDSSLFALEIGSGETVWHKNLGQGWTLEGPMLLSSTSIVSPQGRAPPQVFSREDGTSLGALPGGGGSLVVMDSDENIFHGPGNKGGWITGSQSGSKQKIASFENGRSIVIDDAVTYLLEIKRLSAIDRETGGVKWRAHLDSAHELVVAGDTIFVGMTDLILAIDKRTGQPVWGQRVDGQVHGLAVANGHLVTSTDKGQLAIFAANRNLPASTPKTPLADIVADAGYEFESTSEQQFATEAAATPEMSDDASLLQRWVFHVNQTNCFQVDSVPQQCLLESLAANGNELTLRSDSRFVTAGNEHAWILAEGQDAEVAPDFRAGAYPKEAMTAVATVRIDKGQPWGGLVSMAQDNGAYEKGWILGFRNMEFGFAVNGSEGPDKLTWVLAKESIKAGMWAHVVATYDGERTLLYVNGKLSAESGEQIGPIDYPENTAFHVGSYKDQDEHFFTQGALNEIALYERALNAKEVSELFAERQAAFEGHLGKSDAVQDPSFKPYGESANSGSLAFGDFRDLRWRFVAPGKAKVNWYSELPSKLVLQSDNAIARMTSETKPPFYSWEITGIDRNEIATFALENNTGQISQTFECDGHFDYAPKRGPVSKRLAANSADEITAAKLLAEKLSMQQSRGLALIVGGSKEAQFARDVSAASEFNVTVAVDSPVELSELKGALVDEGLYGSGLSCRTLAELSTLPENVFNLIVVEPGCVLDAAQLHELSRLLKPNGSLVLAESADAFAADPGLRRRPDLRFSQIADSGTGGKSKLAFEHWTANRNEGAASWSHMYGRPDNTAFAGESLQGAKRIEQLRLAWAGRPGPRYQSDRGNRKPSPLAAGGRLYLQGLHRLIGMDAHNGTILWAWELPEMVRFNVPRDCSNWCADEASVFVAIRDHCRVFDGRNGEVSVDHSVVRPKSEKDTVSEYDWGFIARHANLLLGSAQRAGHTFTGYWGSEFWYDAKDGEHAKKVCSDSLFALDNSTGATEWNYSSGLVVNPTISISGNRIVFLECRSDALLQGEERRLGGDEFWGNLFVVALDVRTGKLLWETPAKPMPGVSAAYGVCSEDKFLLQTSDAGSFAMYALNLEDGKMEWRGKYAWEADHHGKHLSRPAIVGKKVYLRPLTLDLDTGKVLANKFPAGHQCGTYTASTEALFLRAGNLAMWDGNSQDATRWNRVRPDCWISTIPAEGMLLSPEGGGGCSCGGWLETSMGFAPTFDE